MKKMHIIAILVLLFGGSVFADAKEIAKQEISVQSELIRKGLVDKLRARFTDRQKERVTADKVKKAQRELKSYTLDDLVDTVIEGEYNGQKTIKIKMKNGRSLTTLVEENGEWHADTIWFR